MKNRSKLKKSSLLLLPLLLSSLNPKPAHALSWFGGSNPELPPMVVRSCSAELARDKVAYKPKSVPLPYPSSPSGGAADSASNKSEASTGNNGIFSQTMSAPPPPAVMRAAPEKEAFSSNDLKEGGLNVHQSGKKVDRNVREASELYLSNDDSMSLASAQRVIYAINNFLPIYQDEVRPHEFLNYFLFKTNPVASGENFSVKLQMAPRLEAEKGESLAISVQGKSMTLQDRRPAVLTFVIDKSGSMAAEGKMAYLKEGMGILKNQLKNGDVVNVVEFDHETCNALEGFVVGRDNWKAYDQTVSELEPRGSTNLHDGLIEGYKLADRFQDAAKVNRLLLITDAIANTGELSPDLMASIGKYFDTKKIALSGIGVGLDFNDELLDTLTDKGKGAYLYIGMREALPRVFGSDFVSLLETVGRDVHFKTFFPKGTHLDIFYGEEVSTEKAKVQAIHYFANTSQLFLLDLTGKAAEGDNVGFQIEYTDPLTDAPKIQTTTVPVAQIRQAGQENIAKARLLMSFTKLMGDTALPGSRPYGGWYQKYSSSGKNPAEAKKECAQTLSDMKAQSAIFSDAETGYVTDLANKYCARF